MIAELQDEKHRLDEAIEALERLSTGGGQKRRGRPPKWMKQDTSIDPDADLHHAPSLIKGKTAN